MYSSNSFSFYPFFLKKCHSNPNNSRISCTHTHTCESSDQRATSRHGLQSAIKIFNGCSYVYKYLHQKYQKQIVIRIVRNEQLSRMQHILQWTRMEKVAPKLQISLDIRKICKFQKF